MLRELKISNLALIEELEISFNHGLIVLTGETGAGKSIILQAIHLLSGGRAVSGWIRTGADSCAVEALFECPESSRVVESIRGMGIETDGMVVIRRLLPRKGKSRFYVNGSLATARVVSEIAENLISVASQHDHQQLLMPASHLDFIDAVGDLWPKRESLALLYDRWAGLKADHEKIRQQEMEREQRRDFLLFQCREIEGAGIEPGEDETLILEKDRLRASDDLMRLGRESYDLLVDSVNEALARIRKNLEQMAEFDRSLDPLAEEVSGNGFQLEDGAARLREYIENIPNDPARLETVTERIHQLQQLKRKYGASLEEVLEYAEKARRELEELEDMDRRLEEIGDELRQVEATLVQKAGQLSKARRRTVENLASNVRNELRALSFDHAEFEVSFDGDGQQETDLAGISRTGWDRPEFLFSANPGEPVKPVAKVASGGELSRLMLALRCLLARKDQVETVIFDEVDAGISGKAAESVARKIGELAVHHQVLCITHLPQIASFADEHYRVEKAVAGRQTRTTIAPLSMESRVEELARMLDGESVTTKTLDYAKALLGRNR